MSPEEFLAKLPSDLRERVRAAMADEAIDDEETLGAMRSQDWKDLGFYKLGEIKKIEKALSV